MRRSRDLISCGTMAGEFQTEGPIQAEVFVVWRAGNGVKLSGPCAPAPWYIEVPAGDDAVAVVTTLARAEVGEPIVVHSTSWRHGEDSVLLTFMVVVDHLTGSRLDSTPVGRTQLARGGATDAPAVIEHTQVLEHGLRHLAWLVKEDPAVSASLDAEWGTLLAEYAPEPFQNLR